MPEHHAHLMGSEFLVCQEAGSSPFDDDLEDSCADCGRMLSFRPYLADETPKLCRACFAIRKDGAGPTPAGGAEA